MIGSGKFISDSNFIGGAIQSAEEILLVTVIFLMEVVQLASAIKLAVAI